MKSGVVGITPRQSNTGVSLSYKERDMDTPESITEDLATWGWAYPPLLTNARHKQMEKELWQLVERAQLLVRRTHCGKTKNQAR